MKVAAPSEVSKARRIVGLMAACVGVVALTGCNAKPVKKLKLMEEEVGSSYPARPVVAAPGFKVVHHDASSFTLVTKDDASDTEIESLIWELHDAARAHSFGVLKIDQKVVDKRDPIVWFHIYRGSTCASEKYASGKLPCGDSYHAAGDYTLGGFTKPERDDGLLREADGREVHLWDPDAGG